MRLFGLGSVCCYPIGYVGVLFLGALLLRATVAAANRLAGASPLKKRLKGYENDEWIGYRDYQQPSGQKAIPEPGTGRSMACLFLVNVASFILAVPIWVLEDHIFEVNTHSGSEEFFLAQIASLLLGFPLYASILANMLPCKFRQGCFVLFLYYLFFVVAGYVLIVILSML